MKHLTALLLIVALGASLLAFVGCGKKAEDDTVFPEIKNTPSTTARPDMPTTRPPGMTRTPGAPPPAPPPVAPK